MQAVDSSTIVPNFIAGAVVIVVGALIVVYRRRLTASIMRTQKVLLPRAVTRMIQRAPFAVFAVGAVGVCAIGMGLFAIAQAVTALNQVRGG